MNPEQPAPPGEPAWQGLDPALLRLRRGLVLAYLGWAALVLGVALWLLVRPLYGLFAAVVALALVPLCLGAVRRRFEAWGYAEREDDLLLRRGVLVRRTSVVPYGRMQYVDVTAGPLDRRLGLARVVLHTAAAATDAALPGLATAEADRLRDRLAALGEARAAGV